MMTKISILSFFIILCINLFAQDDKSTKHPIDLKMEQCLNNDSSFTTHGMIDCTLAAFDEWDKELNKYYRLLSNVLEEGAKVKLKKAQLNWLVYHDSEFEFSNEMYYDMEGTMWRVVGAGRRTDIVKARVLELKEYFDTYTHLGK